MGEKNKNEKKDRKEVEWGNGDNELLEAAEYEDSAKRDDNNRDNGDNELLEEFTMMEEKKDSKHKKD